MSENLNIAYTFWEKLVNGYTLYTGYIEVWLFYGYTMANTMANLTIFWC